MGGRRAWSLYHEGGMEGGVLKPKLDSLLLCVTFNPRLFFSVVLSSNKRCWESYHIKYKMRLMRQGGMEGLGRWDSQKPTLGRAS